MTGEEYQDLLARAAEGVQAKWEEIGRLRENYLELQAHAMRAQEEVSRLMEEVEQARLLYEALLEVRPADTPTAAPAADRRGGRKPGRVARRKRKGKAEGGEESPPAAPEGEGGAEG